MTYGPNPLMVELMVPRHETSPARLHSFYKDIGWEHRNDTRSELEILANPALQEGPTPVIAYWQTANPEKIAYFEDIQNDDPSIHSVGLRLPEMQQLVEICLVVPTDDDVHSIFEAGGQILAAHTHTPLREHAGRQEFRFVDPFNYSLRITTDPGWEIRPKRFEHADLSGLPEPALKDGIDSI